MLSPLGLVIFTIFSFLSCPMPTFAQAPGNTWNDSFARAKRTLETEVYQDHRFTLYCAAAFDAEKNIFQPEGFTSSDHGQRAHMIEWEHVVPAENFGKTFKEWREGDARCIDRNERAFKGRKCAGKLNATYRHMQADMYNLYPAIGAVNAARKNYNFAMLAPHIPSAFGSCHIKIEGNKMQPPARARGVIARTYLYMAATYKSYSMSKQQEQLFTVWDKSYPVDSWECTRAKRIEALQGNENGFVKKPCQHLGLW